MVLSEAEVEPVHELVNLCALARILGIPMLSDFVLLREVL
jgi:hypothetical protein